MPVEDPGDLRVGVVHGQATDQLDGVLAGADRRRLAFERHHQLADRAALPAQQQVGSTLGGVAVDGDVDLLQQGAQQLLAVLVGGGRRRPDLVEVVAEAQDRGALVGSQCLGPGCFPAGQFVPGLRQVAEAASQAASRPRATRRLSGSTAW